MRILVRKGDAVKPTNPMNRQQPVSLLAALAAGLFLVPLNAAADDGTTGEGNIRYITGTVTWTQDHVYDDWGPHTSLSVGTGAGEGHLSVQEGAWVEVPGALFIAGKGYNSPYSIEEGHDGLVTVGAGSTLECGSLTSSPDAGHIYVGWGSGVKGTLRVNGGELISNYMLHVGCHVDSDGLLEVSNGGRVTLGLGEKMKGADASFLSIATAAGSRGLIRVSGGSTLAFEPGPGEQTRADIGTGGYGTLLVEEGSRVSLGRDFALIGVENGAEGVVCVSGGSLLELPQMTYMARERNTWGEMLVEGDGTRLTGQDMSVGEEGDAIFVLQEGATGALDGRMWVGTGTGFGRVAVFTDAQLASAGDTVVGGNGGILLADSGQWVSSSPVLVQEDGFVLLSDSSRWEAQGGAEFQPGSALTFAVESAERVPELVVSPGETLTMTAGSRMQLILSPNLLQAVFAEGGLELPLITGELVDEGYDYELLDRSGMLDASGLSLLEDGQWGLRVTLDRPALQRSLQDDSSRLANGLWSSTGVMQDYTSALFDRAGRASRGRHVWGMGLGSFSHMDAQGGSSGFDFNGGGYALGADTALDERTTLGLSFGQLYGSNKSSDGIARIRQNSLMGALYARYDSQAGSPGRRMVLDAYAAYGRVRNHARSSVFANGVERSYGRWWDDVFALGLRASWERPLTEDSSLMPFIGLRYIHGSHGGFMMTSGEFARGYSSSRLHNFSLPLGFTLRSRHRFGRVQELLPELTLAYVRDLSRHNPHITSNMLGEEGRARGASPGRNAFMLRAGAAWILNEHWSTGLYYHLECRRREVDQAVDMSVSYGF